LPDITYVASNGHIVKGAAQALKARIQLFNGDYASAAATAKLLLMEVSFHLIPVGTTLISH